MTPLRIGVMGGSFDPVHNGHLVAASEVAHRFALDRVIFSPTGEAWHKSSPNGAPAELRYLMTVVATASDPRFDVTRVDIDRPGPTYTVDTLRDLQQAVADAGDTAEWFFITGADALADIVGWRDPDGILARAHLVGVTRPGHVLKDPGCLPAPPPWSRCPHSRSRRRTCAPASRGGSRSATSCPPASRTSSRSTTCTSRHDRAARVRRAR